ncbi:hypothetical protein [Ruegeria sp. MALMAid1280]|uniref:hypothetical protein n=1 Tax=Ruegeria sp. MALMAid1280 TaxID=3411634 RepID=UPI003BA2C2AC
MKEFTRKLWDKQYQHHDDRLRLFRAAGEVIAPETVLYAGSFVDIAPSFVFPNVTYVDMDRRAKRFFEDEDGVKEIVEAQVSAPSNARFSFIHSDYSGLSLPERSIDLLISLYAGLFSEHCTKYLKVGGHLLVNPSHGDAALASLDKRYQLAGVVLSRSGDYRVSQADLSEFLQPKKSAEVTRELLFSTNRGVAYTRPAFAYLFERVV